MIESIAQDSSSEVDAVLLGVRLWEKFLNTLCNLFEKQSKLIHTLKRDGSEELNRNTGILNKIIHIQIPPHDGKRVGRVGWAAMDEDKMKKDSRENLWPLDKVLYFELLVLTVVDLGKSNGKLQDIIGV